MDALARAAAQNLATLRAKTPLVHNITNLVVMNYTANALLAMGASPVMAHALEEVAEMTALAGALVLNIGTLAPEWVESMLKAGQKALQLGIPVILDPVGSGATSLRTRTAGRIIAQARPAVVRGNASEILSLRQAGPGARGVDSRHGVDQAAEAARCLAAELTCVVAITGPVDFVTDGRRSVRVANGHPLMGRVTGTGCTATAAIAAFLAVDPDALRAAATALAYFGLAGETAARSAAAPGSFMIAMLDALYTITPEQLQAGCRIEETADEPPAQAACHAAKDKE
ncbi:MAG: hydroxyethylthiazole kinase [Desulfobacterales bacterium]|jgi:hydroxyethylthiazole kinase|nr:hydroxyethylthiazole kinase [Desulfobacterales bacterium]